jgi:Fur family ferric uptake transcriptional regulator
MQPDQLLREHGVQVTAQRIAVINAVTTHKHVSADVIATTVRSDIGSISRQSVYDTLTLLVTAGLVRKIQPVGSPALFERDLGDNHHHIICRVCHGVETLDLCMADALERMARQMGYANVTHTLEIFGVCKKCQAAK